MPYIGNCTGYYSIKKFLSLDKQEWLNNMSHNIARVSPYEVNESQIRAWDNCFDVLQKSLSELPESFRDLHIIFEYVLPQSKPGTRRAANDNGKRADVIILSSKTVCVLEFKQKNENVFIGNVRQARMYRNRIQDYHVESIGMNKKAILVMTHAKEFTDSYKKVKVCSPDILSETIVLLFEDKPEKNDPAKWIESEFKARPAVD